MSLNEKKQEDLFAASTVLKNFLKEKDPLAIFSREIYPKFTDREFVDCYSEKGRNAIPTAFLSMVTLLQFRENMSDPEDCPERPNENTPVALSVLFDFNPDSVIFS